MKVAPIITALNAGELSPALDGRTDLSKYQAGCKLLENFIPLVQGPAERRAGFRYVKPVKTAGSRVWLLRFEFSATIAYVLEFGDLYVRFYTERGQLLSGGVPYEIVSPYSLANLTNDDGTCALKVVQSGDVLYIANQKRTIAPQKLTRLATTSWAFSEYQPDQGPFLETNTGTTTIYASGSTGSVTLTASAATFASTDVGRLVRLQVQNLDVKPWETGKSYSTNDLVRYGGKTFKALNTATSGTSPPIHDSGNAYDGIAGVQWAYQDAGYGVARITAFSSSTSVTADVIVDATNGLNQLPANVVGSGNASTRWALGAWSGTTEYPGTVAFFRNRLIWAGRQRLWASVPNDFENMAGDFFGVTRADSAIWTQVQAEDVNDVLWLVGAQRLMIGTGGGEFYLSELTTTDPLGPANYKIERISKQRVRAVQPLAVGTSLLYVQRAGRKLLGIDYTVESDNFVSSDLAVLANRITRGGIVDMAFQSEPWSVVWCVLSNGRLLGFTYDRQQEVTGWHRHPVGGDGFVESVAVVPSPDGSREDLWIVVRRTINGSTVRYVEFLEAPWEGPDEDGTNGDDQADAFYVDSGLTYDGAATTSITGLSHLEGETVQILADGATQPDKTVTGGAITLSRAASVVQVGLQASARLVTMRLEAGSGDGTSQGKTKRVHRAVVRFGDTLGGAVGQYGGTVDDISTRSPSTPMGEPEPIFSGDVDVDFPGDYETDCRIEIRQDQPLPMTVVAIMPRLRTYDP